MNPEEDLQDIIAAVYILINKAGGVWFSSLARGECRSWRLSVWFNVSQGFGFGVSALQFELWSFEESPAGCPGL